MSLNNFVGSLTFRGFVIYMLALVVAPFIIIIGTGIFLAYKKLEAEEAEEEAKKLASSSSSKSKT